MNRFKYVFILLSLFSGPSLKSLGDSVAFPTGDAAWIVDIKDETPPTPQVPVVHAKHVEVTQLNKVKRTVITWSDGKITEKWALPGLPVTFEEDPRNRAVVPFQSASLRSVMTNFFVTYDSVAFDWVSANYLKEKDPIEYSGKLCYHYIGSFTPPMQKTSIKKEAWIDAKTFLPVALDTEVALTTFKFQDKPPTGPLVMPPSFQESVKYYKMSMGYP